MLVHAITSATNVYKLPNLTIALEKNFSLALVVNSIFYSYELVRPLVGLNIFQN